MIGSYFTRVKTYLIISPVIKSYTTVREFLKELEGYIRIKAILKNDDELEIFIYIKINGKLKQDKYSFHWQSKDGKLIKRWDNAPHHPELKTFPHHLHHGSEILPNHQLDIFQVLKLIEKDIKLK